MAENVPQPGENADQTPGATESVRPFAWVERLLMKAAMWEYDGTLPEISRRAYKALPDPTAEAIETGQPDDAICDLAKQLYEDELGVYDGVIDKTRALLGLCPLLITLFSLLLPRITYPWLGILPLLFFLAALVLLLSNMGVSTRSTANMDELVSETDAKIVRRSIAAGYYHATHLNSCRTAYAVDVYKASARYIGAGVIVLSGLLVASLVWPPDQKSSIIVQPASMPAPIINLLPQTMPAPAIHVMPASMPAPVIVMPSVAVPSIIVNVAEGAYRGSATAPSHSTSSASRP